MKRECALKIFEEGLSLMIKKNFDYTGNGKCIDNISLTGLKGISVRMLDKVARLLNLSDVKIDEGNFIQESLRDTLVDLMNYANIGIQLLDDVWNVSDKIESCKKLRIYCFCNDVEKINMLKEYFTLIPYDNYFYNEKERLESMKTCDVVFVDDNFFKTDNVNKMLEQVSIENIPIFRHYCNLISAMKNAGKI